MHTLFHCIYTKNIAVFGRFVNLFFQKPILFILLLVSIAASQIFPIRVNKYDSFWVMK